MSASDAQIYSQGYRRYEGPRGGLQGAIKSLVVHSARDAMGIGRKARFKFFPFMTVIFAYLPAVVFVGVAALLPEELDEFLPTYAGYYGYVVAALYLFVGFIAPEILCKDRRTGMLGVYLASPLNRVTYLIGKAITVAGLMMVVTLGPPLLMLIAYSLSSTGPDGFVAWIDTFLSIVASSLIIGLMYSAVAMGVASLTDRTAVATATVLALFPGSAIVSDVLVNDADLPAVLRLLNVPNLPRELIFRVHDEWGLWPPSSNLSTPVLTLGVIGWTAGSVLLVWFRYRRLLVRR